MSAPIDPQIDTTLRKEQLITLNKNLNILLEREAKYGSNAPLDLLNQIADHRQAINLIQQALSGQIAEQELNEALKPLLLALRNGQVIEISVSQPRWLRTVVWATLGAVIIILSGVIFLIFRVGPGEAEQQVFSTPDPSLLKSVEFPDPGWSITALTINNENDKSTLWIGAKSNSKYALYYADTTLKEKTKPERVLDLDGEILDLTVDCKGNIWILMPDIGTLVFRPETGDYDTLLNIETTNHWLPKNTAFAIATRCLGKDGVEVWLGRKGIRTLQYSSDYPTLETIKFLPEGEDDIYQASKELVNVRGLIYVAQNETLWAVDLSGVLFSFSLNRLLSPQLTRSEQTFFSIAQSPNKDAIWVGADTNLIQVKGEKQNVSVEKEDGTPLNNHTTELAVNDKWVWFGGMCSITKSTCDPLGVYNHQNIIPVEIGSNDVNAIAVDQAGAVWIGTEQKLLRYPNLNQ